MLHHYHQCGVLSSQLLLTFNNQIFFTIQHPPRTHLRTQANTSGCAWVPAKEAVVLKPTQLRDKDGAHGSWDLQGCFKRRSDKTTRTGCTQRWRCRRWCQAVGENDLIPKWLSFSTWIYHQSWSPCSHQKCGLKQQPRGNMCVQPSNPFPAITPIYLMLIKESANSECLNHGFYRFKIWDYSTFQTLLKKHDATFQIDTSAVSS